MLCPIALATILFSSNAVICFTCWCYRDLLFTPIHTNCILPRLHQSNGHDALPSQREIHVLLQNVAATFRMKPLGICILHAGFDANGYY